MTISDSDGWQHRPTGIDWADGRNVSSVTRMMSSPSVKNGMGQRKVDDTLYLYSGVTRAITWRLRIPIHYCYYSHESYAYQLCQSVLYREYKGTVTCDSTE